MHTYWCTVCTVCIIYRISVSLRQLLKMTETVFGLRRCDRIKVWANHQKHNNKRNKNKHCPHIGFLTKSVWACFHLISFGPIGLHLRLTWGSLEAHLRLTWGSLGAHLRLTWGSFSFWHFLGSRDDPKTRQKNVAKTKGTNWGSKSRNKRPEPQSDCAGAVQTLFATFYKNSKYHCKCYPQGSYFQWLLIHFQSLFHKKFPRQVQDKSKTSPRQVQAKSKPSQGQVKAQMSHRCPTNVPPMSQPCPKMSQTCPQCLNNVKMLGIMIRSAFQDCCIYSIYIHREKTLNILFLLPGSRPARRCRL